MVRFLAITIMFILCVANQAHARAVINVQATDSEPFPIAITMIESGILEENIAEDIRGVIETDLVNTGLFRSLDPRAFIQNLKGVESKPSFADWKQIEAQALMTATVTAEGDMISLQMRLWDVYLERQYAGKFFKASKASWRRLAHMAADEIYSKLTGEGGYFDTRIVYIAENGSGKNKTKQLAIMDQDGANHQLLTRPDRLVLTPRFDKQAQRIIYMSYGPRKPSVFLYNLETGYKDLLGNFQGMSFAPRFSHSGEKAIMTVSDNGNSDIYIMDIESKRTRQVTTNPAIDTSPSFSPDDKRIVFNSDRGGSQQIYTMDADGSNIKRISFGKGSYATPVWSPRGDLIAFTKMSGGKFFIGVMKPDGKGERILTESYLDEGPTWAPNGRVIMFFRKQPNRGNREGETHLYSVDLTGKNLRRVPTPVQGSDPAWSPLLSKK